MLYEVITLGEKCASAAVKKGARGSQAALLGCYRKDLAKRNNFV